MERFTRGPLTFDVRDGGHADATQTVVLLHGFPQDSTCWDAVTPGLHAAGLRTLAPDQRGYSPGARPPGRRAYTMQECADDVLAMMDEAGLATAHVVGHDWGGAVAWHLAGRDPDRVSSVTVLSTPHSSALGQAWFTSTQGLKSWYMLALQLPFLPELVTPRLMAQTLPRTGLPAAAAEHYSRRLGEPGAAGPAVNWYRALPFARQQTTRRSRVPTTYGWGSRDPFLGRAAAEATETFVLGPYRFVVIDGGHWLPETRPAEVTALVLAQVRDAAAAS